MNIWLSLLIMGGTLKSGVVGASQLQSNAVTTAKIQNGSVTATKLSASSPSSSQVLSFDGTNLTWVTPTSAGPVPDATDSVKGLIQLAGDLAGNADAPTVPGLSSKEPVLVASDLSQYYRGDKTWQPLNKSAVLLANVDNTSDVNKPISSATQAVLDTKADADALNEKADDDAVVHLAGNETITGVKNYTGTLQSYGQAVVITTDSRLTDERATIDNTISVAKIQDEAVTEPKLAISNTPSDGQVLSFSGSDMVWTTPAEGAGDATTGAKGVVQLAGDLSGSADAPTVPGLTTKEPVLDAGTSTQYYRGDKTWQTLNKNSVGLTNVDNTADINKPISEDVQAALDDKVGTSEVVLLAGDQLIAGTKNYVGSLEAGGQAVVTTDDARLSNERTPTDDSVSSTKIQNEAVTEEKLASSNTPVDGQLLGFTNGDMTWQTLDTTAPDATDSIKGIIQLAGDLAGAADAPTVPGLATKEPFIDAGTSTQYYRGDKTWQTLNKNSVGLTNVDNTSDQDKPVSAAIQSALDSKADQDTVAEKADDDSVIHLTGNETITGVKNYTGTLQAYGQAVVTTDDSRLSNERTPTNDSVESTKIQDNAVTEPKLAIANNPTDGQLLGFESGELAWQTLDTTVADATDSSKGVIQLAGDLSGTASSPTVPALAGKEPSVVAGDTTDYYRGDKTWQTLNKNSVGLTNVDNTADIDKPVSVDVQAALDTKASQAAVGLKADDDAVVHLDGNEIIEGVKNYTGTLQAYGQAVVTTDDSRLTDTRTPTDASVTAAKLQDGIVGESKLDTSNTPADNQVLSFDGSDLTWITPLEAAPDASDTTKGLIQLAGDLAGTAEAPTVPALAGKEPTVAAGTTMQYYRGDKTWQTLDRAAFNLEFVDNTADIEKPISEATQDALDLKANDNAVVHLSGTQTIIGNKDFTGGITINSADIIVDSDTRLTDQRVPTNNSVSEAKVQDEAITESKLAIANSPADNQVLTYNDSELTWVTPAALTIKEENSNITTSASSINFTGSGVTATNSGDAVTVTVPFQEISYPYSVSGVLYTQTGQHRLYIENSRTVASIRASVGTAPTGASVIVDVLKNGTSIFNSTPANRPIITAGTFTDLAGAPDTTTFAQGDYMTINISQVGSTIAGSDLTVLVRLV